MENKIKIGTGTREALNCEHCDTRFKDGEGVVMLNDRRYSRFYA